MDGCGELETETDNYIGYPPVVSKNDSIETRSKIVCKEISSTKDIQTKIEEDTIR